MDTKQVGRPTKYNKDTLLITLGYLDSYRAMGDIIPSIAGLAGVLEVSRETIYEWAADEKKSEFSYIVARLQAAQETVLHRGGLSKSFDSGITRLLLGKHGYAEKQEVKQDSVSAVANVSTEDYAKARREMLKNDDC